MRNYDSVREYYLLLRKNAENELIAVRKQVFRVGTLRLAVFLGVVFSAYWVWGQSAELWSIPILLIVTFLWLLKYHNRLFEKRNVLEVNLQISESELLALKHNFSSFDGGAEFSDSEHSFCNDRDFFGNRSVFQSINRTITENGKRCLAEMFLHPLDDCTQISQRQQAVRELANKPEFVLKFRSQGKMAQTKEEYSMQLSDFQCVRIPLYWSFLCWAIPLLYVLALVFWGMELLPTEGLTLLYLATFFLSLIPMRRIKKMLHFLDKGDFIPRPHRRLIPLMEKECFEGEEINAIKQKILHPTPASQTLHRLKRIQDGLDLAFTFPMLLIFNPLILWNVRYALQLQKWMSDNSERVKEWTNAVAEMEALVSLGIYSFNNPNFVFPQPTEQVMLDGKRMGHPLLRAETLVANDIDMHGRGKFWVVTGANMAGKSTYLRTIGVNHVLACSGSVVCAASYQFYPLHLVTNLRNADSLNDSESYFFAELKRLKMIINRLQAGEEMLVILDEILRGTNSEDKRKGSLALIKQLLHLQANGIIATHDLEVGTLAADFPGEVSNYCFEADIVEDTLSFSYKLRKGVAQNMNATFLMRKMGIVGV